MVECDGEVAARYRSRAEELRTIAESIGDADVRRTLIEVAVDYEGMARTRERLAKMRKENRPGG